MAARYHRDIKEALERLNKIAAINNIHKNGKKMRRKTTNVTINGQHYYLDRLLNSNSGKTFVAMRKPGKNNGKELNLFTIPNEYNRLTTVSKAGNALANKLATIPVPPLVPTPTPGLDARFEEFPKHLQPREPRERRTALDILGKFNDILAYKRNQANSRRKRG